MTDDRVAALEARVRTLEAREERRRAFLGRAHKLLDEPLGLADAIAAIEGVFVDELADRCVVALSAHNDAAVLVSSTNARELLRTTTPSSPYTWRRPNAFVVHTVPLVLRGQRIGVLRLERTRGKLDDDDIALAEEVAHCAALAVERAQLLEQAQRAVAARDQLLEAVVHDLRTYLTTIRFSGNLLAKALDAAGDARPSKGRPHVDAITLASKRMDELILALRDATMIESGRFRVDVADDDLGSIVEEARRTWTPIVEAKGVSLAVDVAPIPLACDRRRVLQVLANLLGNALRFTPAGGEIRIEIAGEIGDDDVILLVRDTGEGIPPQHVPHVFDRHYSTGDGGLGLFIARGIVEAHRGRIDVDSTLGAGTRFTIRLPRKR